MKTLILLGAVLIITGCRGEKNLFNSETVSYIKFGRQIVVPKDNLWFVYEDDLLYPASTDYINSFLSCLNRPTGKRVVTDDPSLFPIYGIYEREDVRIESSSGIISLSIGKNSPGNLGLYIKFSDRSYIEVIEGEIVNYPFNINMKQLNIKKEFTNYKAINSVFINSSSSLETINFNKLLQVDVMDLVKSNRDLPPIGNLKIETDDGKTYNIEVKKRAENYILNFQAPYSYLISPKSFRNLF